MSKVTLRNLKKHYGGFAAVNGVNLKIAEGEFLTLLGPSGCGKTTTLRMIAGFTPPTDGEILFGDEDVTALPPRRRNIGMVFQDYALFPHLTVFENIIFGLRERRAPKHTFWARAKELLDLVRLPGVEDRYPEELSGGQQQRIALARALAHSPRVLLMDEPLGALDLKLREAMQIELHRIQRELRITTIFVTHDQEEAMSLSDRIAVMADGHIHQVGTPEDLYLHPQTPFVAHFIGKTNFLEATIDVGGPNQYRAALPNGTMVNLVTDDRLAPGEPVRIAIRPEWLAVERGASPAGGNRIAGTIERRRFLGNVVHYFIRTEWNETVLVEDHRSDEPLGDGDAVLLSWLPERAIVFAHAGGGKDA